MVPQPTASKAMRANHFPKVLRLLKEDLTKLTIIHTNTARNKKLEADEKIQSISEDK